MAIHRLWEYLPEQAAYRATRTPQHAVLAADDADGSTLRVRVTWLPRLVTDLGSGEENAGMLAVAWTREPPARLERSSRTGRVRLVADQVQVTGPIRARVVEGVEITSCDVLEPGHYYTTRVS